MIGQTGCFPQLIWVNSIWYIHRKIRFPCPLNVGTVVNSPVMRIPHIISDLRIWTGNLNTQTILFLDHHQTQSPLHLLCWPTLTKILTCVPGVFPVNYYYSTDPMVAPIANPFLNDQFLRKTSPLWRRVLFGQEKYLACTNPPFEIIMGIHKFTFEESRHVEAWYISVCFGSRQSWW